MDIIYYVLNTFNRLFFILMTISWIFPPIYKRKERKAQNMKLLYTYSYDQQLCELGWTQVWLIFWSHLLFLLEKAMAPHSSTLAWKIPWMEEPGGLQSMGSLRVRHDWATSLSLSPFMHWRRKWQPTPVFLPGESQGQGSLVGWRLWGHTESDTTEVT